MQKRVLIVEDNGIIALELKRNLQNLGYAITDTTGTGEDAIAVCASGGVDIVIMDIKLAGALDGVETADVIIKQYQLPVVYVTAHSDEATIQRAKKTNPAGYLIKPFDAVSLRTVLEIAIHKANSEKKLRDSEALFRTLVEASQDGIVIIRDNYILYANKTFSEMLGLFGTFLPGTLFTRYFTATDTKIVKNAIDSVLAGSESCSSFEVEALHDMNGQLYVELAISPIGYQGDDSLMVTIRDITLKKQREMELVKLNEDMKRADYLKTEFIGLISHEIRTPINILHGYIAILEDDLDGGNNSIQETAFSKIHSSTRRLIDATDKIVEYSQLAANAYKVNKTTCIIEDDILEELIFDFTLLAQKKGLRLFYDNKASGVRVHCDKAMTRKILENLIDNAIKYTDSGRVHINQLMDNNQLVLEIADTGPGIDNTYIRYLFESATPSDLQAPRSFNGNGLGLTMVKRYAELNSIKINLISEIGRGTIAKVVFN